MRNFVCKLCVILGVFGLALFVLPMFLSVKLNIGNGTGILIALLLIGIRFQPEQLKQIFCGFPRWIRRGIALLLVVILLLTCVLTGLMWHTVSSEPEERSVVIVLGCMIYGDQPSLALKERLDAAIDYLESNGEAVCILSGGQGTDEQISEAQCMYNYMTAHGVDPMRLYMEDQSTSTKENMLFSKAIIEEQGWSKQVAVVTNEFHEYRACYIASAVGLEPAAVPASTAWWLLPTYYVRELYGILYEWVRTN